jgi:chromate transporter
VTPGLWLLVRYFLWLGATGFGGPIALVGYMQRDLAEQRGWFTAEEVKRGVVFSQLAPGPLAAQLAIYLGWKRYGVTGATLCGIAFVAPSLVMVIALAIAYQRFQGLTWLRAAFYGVSAAVLAIIARAAVKLARLTLTRDRLLWFVFALNGVATVIARAELVSVLLVSGLLVLIVRQPGIMRKAAPPSGVAAAAFIATSSVAPAPTLFPLFWFFAKAGLVVFGSGLAIVPFLYAAVERYHWLTEQQFLDAIAVSLITPGPVVITVAFIGHLLQGLPGALIAALGVFLPVYLSVVLGAPLFERHADRPAVRSALAGLAAAATGALAGAAIILGQRALVDLPAAVLALASFGLLTALPKLPEPAVVLAAGLVGVLIKS